MAKPKPDFMLARERSVIFAREALLGAHLCRLTPDPHYDAFFAHIDEASRQTRAAVSCLLKYRSEQAPVGEQLEMFGAAR